MFVLSLSPFILCFAYFSEHLGLLESDDGKEHFVVKDPISESFFRVRGAASEGCRVCRFDSFFFERPNLDAIIGRVYIYVRPVPY